MPALVADQPLLTVPDLTVAELAAPDLVIHEFDQWWDPNPPAAVALCSTCIALLDLEAEAA